ncbi:LacI family DNA-binding transcriptional regulator [Microbacterium sp. NPDC089189]|uniref:LacI family DNA-binding transcriptional regulator n=1 Tax=Microbacterium sp. NPDC089189 TaxID=3154972 RepID=UPI0034204990
MDRRANLKDVAAAAGVSPATASRVLSGVDRNVDPALVARVRDAQLSLGYRVNAAARALRLQSTGSIGLLVPAIDNAYFAELVAAYSRHLDADGRRLVTIDTNESVASESRQLADMDRVLVDAVLIVPVDHDDSAAAVRAVAAGHRVVQVDRVAAGVDLPFVHLDNAAGMDLLVAHLRAIGRRRIVLVDAQTRSSASHERMRAFTALAGPDDATLQMPSFSVSSGIEAARELLARHPDADAVICTADVVALGVLTALQHAGTRVPDDVAIASFDGTSLADVAAPGLTSLASATTEIVQASLAIADGTASESVLVAPRLVVRGSTKPH